MKYLSCFCLIAGVFACISDANASYDARRLRAEIQEGVDVNVARVNVDVIDDVPAGALGGEIYSGRTAARDNDTTVFIPTSMYVRGGAGLTLGFASDRARMGWNDAEYELSDTWNVQLGLGWNLSSYVRGEIDFQTTNFAFSDLDDLSAQSRQIGATLYFDFLRRWVRTGDVTHRRTIVPFMGIGVGAGTYEFQGPDGADGFMVAPRAIAGLNIMLTDIIGVDLAWQYQMRIGNGFGWHVGRDGVDNMNTVMLSIRTNF